MVQPIRVILVDDHAMVLESLSDRLRRYPGIDLTGTATTGDDALTKVLQSPVDVVVMDIELPGRGAFDVASEMIQRCRGLKVLFLSGFAPDVFIDQALQIGAMGYVTKGEPIDVLASAIESVARGEPYYSEAIRSRVRFDAVRRRYVLDHSHPLGALTTRQVEVLRHLAQGQSVKEVARMMHLSQKSVDSHKYRIMHKLAIHDRVELARYAIREGLTQP